MAKTRDLLLEPDAPRRPRVVVLTGAGLSADSGIRTFRDSDGLWEEHAIDVVANGRTWRHHVPVMHAFYNARRAQLRDVAPNAAHRMLARLGRRHGIVQFTQNVDDLLEKAGCRDVLHVHGSLLRMACVACGRSWEIGTAARDPEVDRCACGSRRGVRPGVVFFEEEAPLYPRLWNTLGSLAPGDVFLVMGTSGQVLPVDAYAGREGVVSILANLGPYLPGPGGGPPPIDESRYDHVLHGRAAETAPAIEALVDAAIAEARARAEARRG